MHIGNLTPSKEGGWIGFIHTLTIHNTKVRLVPNDDRMVGNAPAFHVLVGNFRAGCAWEGKSSGNAPKTYFRVHIDDPVLGEPITATLFPSDSGNSAQLIWNRREGR